MDLLPSLLAAADPTTPAAASAAGAFQLTTLHVIWFVVLGVLLIGYAILDGFDLGVGILHLFVARNDTDRRVLMNSIGPLWDGNEVWLVTFGGALFAAFPEAYATAFSGLYLPFMLLLFALIFRAVSMEFRSKRPGRFWRRSWDVAFSGASALATFLFGVAVGTSIKGMPLDAEHEYTGTIVLDLIGLHLPGSAYTEGIGLGGIVWDPFPLMVGLLAVATFAMHGAIFIYLKTEGELQKRAHRMIWRAFGAFVVLYVLTTVATLIWHRHALGNFSQYPAAWIVVVLNLLAILNIPRAVHLGRPLYAFISSCCTIAALVFLFGAALFPNMILSVTDPAIFAAAAGQPWAVPGSTLTLANAASSETTLMIMLVIACIGMPFVIAYTAVIYWTFRGKVEIGKFSY